MNATHNAHNASFPSFAVHRLRCRRLYRGGPNTTTTTTTPTRAAQTFDGTSLFTLYEQLNGENVIFPSFLESALHVCEVSRSHPGYLSAHFHEKLGADQSKQMDTNLPPHQYLNYTLFVSPPEEVFTRFEDLFESADIAHPPPQKYALLSTKEVDIFPKNDGEGEGEEREGNVNNNITSTFARLAKVSVDQETKTSKLGLSDRNVAVVIAIKVTHALDAEKWVETFGIDEVEKKLKRAFQLAVLHEVKLALGSMTEHDEASQAEGDAEPFTHVVYASLGEVADEDAEEAVSTIIKSLEEGGILDGSVVHAFKCVFNIAKTGSPCGALPAVHEMQKRKEENERARKNGKF